MNEISFLEAALKIRPKNNDSSDLKAYRAVQLEGLQLLKESNPDEFIIKARRYLEYQTVLDFAESEIQNLPRSWDKNLWRDSVLFYGDRIFDLIAKALDLNEKLYNHFQNPHPVEFSSAIKDKAAQFLLNFPTMNNGDAQSVERYLELAETGLKNIQALPEYQATKMQSPSNWNMEIWDLSAHVYGRNTLKYLKDAIILESILQNIREEIAYSHPLNDSLAGQIDGIMTGFRNPQSPIDIKLSISKAKKIAKNFSGAMLINSAPNIESEIKNILTDRIIDSGGSAVKDFFLIDKIKEAHQSVTNFKMDLLPDSRAPDLHDPVYFSRLANFLKVEKFLEHDKNIPGLTRDFTFMAMAGMPLVFSNTLLPPQATIGVEIELFGIDGKHHEMIDSVFSVLNPGISRAVDVSIRPDDGTEGLEIISPIIKDNFEHIIAVAEILKNLGGKTALPCALHTHHGLSQIFNDRQLDIAKQAKLNYLVIEDDLSFLDSPLTHYYRQVFSDNGMSHDESVKAIITAPEITDLMRATQPGGRRRARINLQSVFEHGTLEFRQHPGTIDPAEIKGWIKFVSSFMEHAANMVKENGMPKVAEGCELDHLKKLVRRLKEERITHIFWNYPNPQASFPVN